MKDEGKELKVGQRMFINKILDNDGRWLYQVGWGDREYIRLFDILRDGKYFEWDKSMLNEMRKRWLVGNIFNANGISSTP